MYEELAKLLEDKRETLIDARLKKDMITGAVEEKRRRQAYNQIMDSLLTYLRDGNVNGYMSRLQASAKDFAQIKVAIQTMMETGATFRLDCIALIETTYNADVAKRDRFVRKLKSLQALSASILINTDASGKM